MTNVEIAIVDVAYWPVIQISVSALMVRVPQRCFSSGNSVRRPHSFEGSLKLYRKLQVHRWKKRLPDWGSLVGGEPKRLNAYEPADRSRFRAETRRAEIAHWMQLICAAFCWIWNPFWAAVLMTVYAILTNAPCIVAQRYNRILLLKTYPASKRNSIPNY